VSFQLSYILRYVSFTEVDNGVVLREPMHLCTCVNEEGGHGEVVCSETPSLLSYTLRYVSFSEVGSVVVGRQRLPGLSAFYYESIIQELKRRLIYEIDRCVYWHSNI
jgi:hypothetical protein